MGGQDDVTIAGLRVKNVQFGAVSSAQGFNGAGIDGLMGLAYSSISSDDMPPVFDDIVAQNLVSQNLFSMFLSSEVSQPGELIFGGFCAGTTSSSTRRSPSTVTPSRVASSARRALSIPAPPSSSFPPPPPPRSTRRCLSTPTARVTPTTPTLSSSFRTGRSLCPRTSTSSSSRTRARPSAFSASRALRSDLFPRSSEMSLCVLPSAWPLTVPTPRSALPSNSRHPLPTWSLLTPPRADFSDSHLDLYPGRHSSKPGSCVGLNKRTERHLVVI